MPDFIDFISDYPIVAHNADFDMGFLRVKLPRIQMKVPGNPTWDNLKLGVLLYPEMQSFALENLADVFGIPFKKTHRASDDCIATGQLFVIFLRNAPSIWDREFWEWLTTRCLVNTDIGDILTKIFDHPDFDKHSRNPLLPKIKEPVQTPRSTLLKNIRPGRSSNDMLIRISATDSEYPDALLENKKLYTETRRHFFAFPAVQYPGDFWGVDKKWNEIFDRSRDFVLYPGKERLLCKKLLKAFIEDSSNNPLSLKPYEVAVLNSFARTSAFGNFSRLSWWIWNNLPKLAESISFINASNCEHDDCQLVDKCFYMNNLKMVKNAAFVGFPFRVIGEEGTIPRNDNLPQKADLTLFNPEGIFKDNITGDVLTFPLNNVLVLMKRIYETVDPRLADELKKTIAKTEEFTKILYTLVDNLISSAGHKRLQKGRRFFLFITENISGESSELMNELLHLAEYSMQFLRELPSDSNIASSVIVPILSHFSEKLARSIKLADKGELVPCLDMTDNGSDKHCRILFFPEISNNNYSIKYPDCTERFFFVSHHISNNRNWEKYQKHIARDPGKYNYIDLSPTIPAGNRIFFCSSSESESNASKKKIMTVKGDEIINIILSYPGRSLVIVRGSQELLNFKYRLAPKLKDSGYWPLFQKQDGPKGLLIKEFAKHTNVVFFGLADLFEDIHHFELSPDNLILESLYLTSLQDPVEYFIKIEMDKAGIDHSSDYLEPKIHFTLTKSLRRWKNYLDGRGRIFILDEHIQESDYGISFLDELEGERLFLDV